MNGCTIIARNYLAHARICAESFLEQHPGGTFTVLLIDDHEFPFAVGEPFRVLRPHQIGLPIDEVRRMAMIYDVTEFATSVKPWLLRTLLEEHGDHVAYFDPDIRFYEPLDDIVELAREHSIVLIPHLMETLPQRLSEPAQTTVMLAGTFNLGFVAISEQAVPFLDWWCDRLRRECVNAPDRGRFVDQRWVDLVPGLFDHAILKDPGCDTAWWNLVGRSFEWQDGKYFVEEQPLRFFHFSGYDVDVPHLLSKHQGTKPRVLFSEHPALKKIYDEYRASLLDHGYRTVSEFPYGFDVLPNGMPVDRRMRRIYREALLASEDEDAPGTPPPPPPVPFDFESTADVVEWFRSPSTEPGAPPVGRYLHALYRDRPDLQAAFPNLRWYDADRFIDWVVDAGRFEAELPFELVPDRGAALQTTSRTYRSDPVPGITVSGYFRTESGVGEAGRGLAAGVASTGLPYATYTYENPWSRSEHAFDEVGDAGSYDTNLICVNADQLLGFRHDVGPSFFEGRHSIGLWWWEIEKFPVALHDAFGAVDEIWVGSDFVREAIAQETDKPVHTVPIPIHVVEPPPASRAELGLPEGFLFLFSFDFLSVYERKNPLAIVEAFSQAFAPGEASLVLKSINGMRDPQNLEQLRLAAAERPDIGVVDSYVTNTQRFQMTASCDCYVSLHRSEGFGLTMAEAMSFGKPTIGTGYGGNTQFMNADNSYVIPYALTEIGKGAGPYPADAHWAEPDVNAAAAAMRRVFDNREEAAQIGECGRQWLGEHFTVERAGEFVERRFAELHADPAELAAAEPAT